MVTDYSADQLGEILVEPIHSRHKGQYSLVVVQPRSNEQVLVLEPCDWDNGWARTHQMVLRGVDPADIRFTFRRREQLDTDGLPLQHCNAALWWTSRDTEVYAAALAKGVCGVR